MTELTIYGKNRTEHKYTRGGCRGVIVKDGKLLLSVETKTEFYMLPGGGIEKGESLNACVCRELLEETGYIIKPVECFLRLNEYYKEYLFYGYYFICEIVGEGEQKLTDAEKERGMMPVWLPFEEALALFSRHEEWTENDEDRRGTYLREYTALSEYLSFVENK